MSSFPSGGTAGFSAGLIPVRSPQRYISLSTIFHRHFSPIQLRSCVLSRYTNENRIASISGRFEIFYKKKKKKISTYLVHWRNPWHRDKEIERGWQWEKEKEKIPEAHWAKTRPPQIESAREAENKFSPARPAKLRIVIKFESNAGKTKTNNAERTSIRN